MTDSLALRRRSFLGATGAFTLGFTLGETPALAATPAGTRVNSWLAVGSDTSVTPQALRKWSSVARRIAEPVA